jgi:hypothetical protein
MAKLAKKALKLPPPPSIYIVATVKKKEDKITLVYAATEKIS